MRQSRHRGNHQTVSSRPLTNAVRGTRRVRVSLALTAALSLLVGGLVLVSAPAGATPGSTFAVTEVATGGVPDSVAVVPATSTVYAGIDSSQGVMVINAATNTRTALIPLPCLLNTVTADPDTNKIYAICGDTGMAGVEVIDGATNTITTRISLPSTLFAAAAAVNHVTDMLYVADYNDGAVIVINGSTNTVAATIPLTEPSLDPRPRPRGIAVDPATNTIYVADVSGNQVEVIDGTTNQVTGRIALPAGSAPYGVAVDQVAGLVYVAETGTGSISLIHTATNAVSTLASGLTSPEGLALDAGAGTLYAISPTGSVDNLSTTYIVDTASGAIAAQIPRGGTAAAVLAAGGPVYVVGAATGIGANVTVITPSAVNTMSPVIVGNTGFTFTVGQAGQGQLTASATPAATFSATGLPSWLSLSQSGLLSGTPPVGAGGTYSVTVTASNGVAPSASEVISVSVDEPPAITSVDHATFTEGIAGSFTVTATGWPGPIITESGALPAGLTLFSTGVLSGTPAAGTAGVYPITITDDNGVGSPATQAFTLTVNPIPAPAVAVGVEGLDRALWVQSPLGSGWQQLGGVITAPPAVFAVLNPNGVTPVQPWFLATGLDQRLWIRSMTVNWQPIGDALCIGSPAAVITGTGASAVVTVACRGLDNALWYTTTPASGLPAFTGTWTRVSEGMLSAAPAVAPVGNTITFFVRGLDGTIWLWSAQAGWTRTGWVCIGPPAAAQQTAQDFTIFACEGSDHMLWETANSSGQGWAVPVSLGGPIMPGPAVAATTQNPSVLVEGLDQAIWENFPSGAWSRFDAVVVGGVGAAALN